MTDELVSSDADTHFSSMTNISNIAVSGIRAAGVRFAASAENIANANSRGYAPLQAEQISTVVGPVVRVTKTDKPRPDARQTENVQQSEVNVASELVDIIASKYDFKAAVKLLQTEDELNGKLLDILA